MVERWAPPTRPANVWGSNGKPTIVQLRTARGGRSALACYGLGRACSPGADRKCHAHEDRGDYHVNLKSVYLWLGLVGTVLPLSQFLPFLRDHGPDLTLFFQQLFSTPVGGFFGMDVIVSSIVLWVFVLAEGRRLRMKHLWVPIAANVTIGVSLGLPLFLYMRERELTRNCDAIVP